MNPEKLPPKGAPSPAEIEAAQAIECSNERDARAVESFADLWHFASNTCLEGAVWEGVAAGICEARDDLPEGAIEAVKASRDWPGFAVATLKEAGRGSAEYERDLLANARLWYIDSAVALFVATPEDWHDEIKSPQHLIAFLREYAERTRHATEIEREAQAALKDGWPVRSLEGTAKLWADEMANDYAGKPAASAITDNKARATRLGFYIAERTLELEKAKQGDDSKADPITPPRAGHMPKAGSALYADRIDFCANAWQLFESAPYPSDMAAAAPGLYAARAALPSEVLDIIANAGSWHGFPEALRAEVEPEAEATEAATARVLAAYETSSIKVFVEGGEAWPYITAHPLALIALLRELAERARYADRIEPQAEHAANMARNLEQAELTLAGTERRERGQRSSIDSAEDNTLEHRLDVYIAERAVRILKAREVLTEPTA